MHSREEAGMKLMGLYIVYRIGLVQLEVDCWKPEMYLDPRLQQILNSMSRKLQMVLQVLRNQ
jgi:hypothetical protein